jgi:hypothetical protein
VTPRPFVPLADGAQVLLRYSWGLGIVTDRLWFIRQSGSVSSSTLKELADGVWGWFSGELMLRVSHTLQAERVHAIDWTHAGGLTRTSIFSTVFGGDTADPHSANVAVKVRFKGVQPPRNFYNWNYLPGIPLDAVLNNAVDPSFASNLEGTYTSLIDQASHFGTFPAWEWVVTSQAEANAPRTTQLSARLDFIDVMPTVRQRRKRLPIVG